ncbi:MAG: chorismate-binding protein [Natrialbaceae archaeon]|nr:chorismate-binding protein [Natrialbaceae archaeon]
MTLDGDLSVESLLERLSERYPNCYRFIHPGNPGAFFGAPPEQLVYKQGEKIETEALAGSIRRGETESEDEALARAMTQKREGTAGTRPGRRGDH